MQKKRILPLLLAGAMLLGTAGCKKETTAPEESAPEAVSDTLPEPDTQSDTAAPAGDGDLEAALTIPADGTGVGSASGTGSFTGADGKITYTADFTLTAEEAALPVLRITPHIITPEDAERVARAIFGDVEFYEYTSELTKSELEAQIQAQEAFISDRDALAAYYGGDEEVVDMLIEDYTRNIAFLEEELATAPESIDYTPCDWQMHPESYYTPKAEESDDATTRVKAMVRTDDTAYTYAVFNCDEGDYRQHTISVTLDGWTVDMDMAKDQKLDEGETLARVNAILEALDMGQWSVSYNINEDARGNEDMQVTATPVYNGVKTLALPQPDIFAEDCPAGRYEYTEAFFSFTGSRLTSFYLTTPMDVVSVVNENVKTLTPEELVAAFNAWMEQSDTDEYQYAMGEVNQVEAQITAAERGIARVPVSGSETEFYLLPAYAFSGTCTARYGDGSTDEGWERTFAVINAVDGSAIPTGTF